MLPPDPAHRVARCVPESSVRRQLPTETDVVSQWEAGRERGWPSNGASGGGWCAVKYGGTEAI